MADSRQSTWDSSHALGEGTSVSSARLCEKTLPYERSLSTRRQLGNDHNMRPQFQMGLKRNTRKQKRHETENGASAR